MTTWAEFCDALRTEAAAISGLQTVWQDQARPTLNDAEGACVLLAHVSQRTQATFRTEKETPPGDPIAYEIHDVQRCSVLVTIESLNQAHDKAAPGRLAALRLGFRMRRMPGIGLGPIVEVESQDVSAEEDGRIVSRYALLVVWTVDLVYDASTAPWLTDTTSAAATVPYLEHVTVTRGRAFSSAFAVGYD